jgi:chromosomal replication initiation ATPase DnaA
VQTVKNKKRTIKTQIMNIRRNTILPECVNREALCKASIFKMIKTILKYHNVSKFDVAIRSRKRELVDIRHIVHYFLTLKRELSLQCIAGVFVTDHSSVINSRKVVECMIETDKNWNSKIIEIANQIINSTNEE